MLILLIRVLRIYSNVIDEQVGGMELFGTHYYRLVWFMRGGRG